MIGTSDQSCWLAEACKILLLLLLGRSLKDSSSLEYQNSCMLLLKFLARALPNFIE